MTAVGQLMTELSQLTHHLGVEVERGQAGRQAGREAPGETPATDATRQSRQRALAPECTSFIFSCKPHANGAWVWFFFFLCFFLWTIPDRAREEEGASFENREVDYFRHFEFPCNIHVPSG